MNRSCASFPVVGSKNCVVSAAAVVVDVVVVAVVVAVVVVICYEKGFSNDSNSSLFSAEFVPRIFAGTDSIRPDLGPSPFRRLSLSPRLDSGGSPSPRPSHSVFPRHLVGASICRDGRRGREVEEETLTSVEAVRLAVVVAVDCIEKVAGFRNFVVVDRIVF